MMDEDEIFGDILKELSTSPSDDFTSRASLSPPRDYSYFDKAAAGIGSWANIPPRPQWKDTDISSTAARGFIHGRRQSRIYPSSFFGDVDLDNDDWEDPPISPLVDQLSIRRIIHRIVCRIRQEQLIAEINEFYPGLVEIEKNCLDIDNAQNAKSSADMEQLNKEQWEALIALLRNLLQEHHESFLPPPRPPASSILVRLLSKYTMRLRLWGPGIHNSFKRLRHCMSAGLEHMLSLISLSYSMMALVNDTKTRPDIIECELLERLKKMLSVFNGLLKRFLRLRPKLLTQAMIFLYFFSELPSSIKHLDTTAQWRLWPTLVVLWSVYWVSYPDHVSNEQFSLNDQQKLIFNLREHWSIRPTVIMPWDSFEGPSTATLDQSVTNQHSSHIGSGAFNYITSATSMTTSLDTPASVPGGHQDTDGSNPGLSSNQLRLSLETNHQPQPAISSTGHTSNHAILSDKSGSSQPTPLHCNDCGKKLSRLDSLKRHRRERHGGDAGTFRCPHESCKKSKNGFKRPDKLLIHLKSCKGRRGLTRSASTD